MRDTVCICGNQKGGVGKTTTAVHLGVALAERGLRVLIWDLDVNHGATSHLGFPADLVGTFEVMAGLRPSPTVILSGSGLPEGVDLIPASRALRRIDRELNKRDDPYLRDWESLQVPLHTVRGLRRYDVVLLDTGPSANTPTTAAYASADVFLAVLRPERPSAEGLATVLSDMEAARRPGVNPGLRFLGGVLTAVDPRNALSRHYAASYEEFFEARGLPGALFAAQIPTATAFGRAWQARRSLFAFDPKHRALTAVRALADEFLTRLGAPAPAATHPVPLKTAAAG